jgi:hypothetical protein
MGGLRHEDREAEFLGHDVHSGNMVRVLMGDENGGNGIWSNALRGKTATGFATGKAAVYEHARLRRCYNRAVTPAAGGENCNGNGHEG